MDYSTFYAAIEKPFFAPEPWVFGLAWGIIYPLIAVGAVYLLYLAYKKELSWALVGVLGVNMIANFLFTPLQLQYQTQIWATIDILVVLTTLLYLQIHFWKHSKLLFIIFLPYLLWGSFATVLQISIYVLNFA